VYRYVGGQTFERTGRCVTMTTANSPIILCTKYAKLGDSPEIRRLARSIIRWECRPYPTIHPPPLAYLVKFLMPCIAALPMLKYSDIFLLFFPFFFGVDYHLDILCIAYSYCLHVRLLRVTVNINQSINRIKFMLVVFYSWF